MKVKPQMITIDIGQKENQTAWVILGELGVRDLDIRVVQNGRPFDISGIHMSLYVKTPKDNTIFNTIKIVDAKKGKGFITIPEQISSQIGKSKCCITFIKDGKMMLSFNFEIKIQDSVYNEGPIVASDEFGSLVDALSGVADLEGNYVPRLTQLENGKTDKTTTAALSRRVDGVDAQLAEKTFKDEIYIEELYDEQSKSCYYISYIPHKDSCGNVIKINNTFPKLYDNNTDKDKKDYNYKILKQASRETNIYYHNTLEYPTSVARRKSATLLTNAGCWNVVDNNLVMTGNFIQDGNVVASTTAYPTRYSLIIGDDNTLSYEKGNVSATTLIERGVKNCLSGFIPCIINFKEVETSIKNDYSAWDLKYDRVIIGQRENKDIVLLHTTLADGSDGMSIDDVNRILLSKGVKFAYILDGGGSTALVYRGEKLNRNKDKYNDLLRVERPCFNFLYFGNEISSNATNDNLDTASEISVLKNRLEDIESTLLNKNFFDQGFLKLTPKDGFYFNGIENWEGESKNTKVSMHKDYFAYHDYIRNKTTFKVDNETGVVSTTNGNIGNFYDFLGGSVSFIDDFNSTLPTGVYYTKLNALNTPGNVQYILNNYRISTNDSMQIAYPYKNDNNYKVKTRRKVNSGWEAWRDLL